MKLPAILAAMIAALAISSSIASEATEENTEATAPETEKAEAKPVEKKAASTHRKHRMHHRHGSGHRHGHPGNAYDLAFDDPNFPRGTDGSGCGAEPVSQGKILPPEIPGQKGPMVPAGQ